MYAYGSQKQRVCWIFSPQIAWSATHNNNRDLFRYGWRIKLAQKKGAGLSNTYGCKGYTKDQSIGIKLSLKSYLVELRIRNGYVYVYDKVNWVLYKTEFCPQILMRAVDSCSNPKLHHEHFFLRKKGKTDKNVLEHLWRCG